MDIHSNEFKLKRKRLYVVIVVVAWTLILPQITNAEVLKSLAFIGGVLLSYQVINFIAKKFGDDLKID